MSSNSMHSTNSATQTQQKVVISPSSSITNLSLGAIAKSLGISGIIFIIFYVVLFDTNNDYFYKRPSDLLIAFKLKLPFSSYDSTTGPSPSSPTNVSHVVFGIVGSMNTWRFKRAYSESWWRPNVTRGYVFLDRAPTKEFLPWSSSSPPFRVNENIRAGFDVYPGFVRPTQVRIVRTILEAFRESQDDGDVRWFVMADDDTVLVVDNLVETLGKYDHTKLYYIGSNSECVKSNFDFSYEMAFGGAGYALSYPLAAMVAAKLDSCLERYPRLIVSDFILYSCLADLGVALTQNKGFHQIDLRGDISGLLSSHPQTPLLSLHHIDTVNPIFPKKNRPESINHLMKAAKADPSRLLQQTVCHHRPTNWSVSVSWGYSAHIYESVLPRSFLRRPLETFRPWRNMRPPLYMFNTRWVTANPCEAPHVFFYENTTTTSTFASHSSSGDDDVDLLVTTYVRASPRGLPACSFAGNHSADHIDRIRVFSPAKLPLKGGGRECCDVMYEAGINTTEVRYRPCMKYEVTA